MKPCIIKNHFTCDGTGKECINCGESEDVCRCEEEEQDLIDCKVCDGTGRFCVEHESPCGDLKKPPQCDKAKGRKPRVVDDD